VILGVASPAGAQERSVWGFSGSVGPKWRMPSELSILFDAERIDITGGELRAGIVRGPPMGGDWGVSFVHKTFTDDGQIVFEEPQQNCFGSSCFIESASGALRNVTIDGIEAHRFFPFATIKRRAQVGLTIAGGVGSWKGAVLVDENFVDFQGSTPIAPAQPAGIPDHGSVRARASARAAVSPGAWRRTHRARQFEGPRQRRSQFPRHAKDLGEGATSTPNECGVEKADLQLDIVQNGTVLTGTITFTMQVSTCDPPNTRRSTSATGSVSGNSITLTGFPDASHRIDVTGTISGTRMTGRLLSNGGVDGDSTFVVNKQ
jgi:hypothetical protein